MSQILWIKTKKWVTVHVHRGSLNVSADRQRFRAQTKNKCSLEKDDVNTCVRGSRKRDVSMLCLIRSHRIIRALLTKNLLGPLPPRPNRRCSEYHHFHASAFRSELSNKRRQIP